MRFDRTPGCGDRRFEHVPKHLLWCVQSSSWHWLEMKLGASFKQVGLVRLLGRCGVVNTSWCLGCSYCTCFFVLYCSFVSIGANGCAHGHLSKSHLFYNLWVCFHLTLIKITKFYLCLCTYHLVFVSYIALRLSVCLSLSPSLSSPFCWHRPQSCWLTSDPTDLPCGCRFSQ